MALACGVARSVAHSASASFLFIRQHWLARGTGRRVAVAVDALRVAGGDAEHEQQIPRPERHTLAADGFVEYREGLLGASDGESRCSRSSSVRGMEIDFRADDEITIIFG